MKGVNEYDEQGFTPLIWAIHSPSKSGVGKGNVEMVKVLLDGGADPNKCSEAASIEQITSPLVSAIEVLNIKIVQMLIEKGADLNFSDEDFGLSLPVIVAISEYQSEILELLLKNGADANRKDGRANESPIELCKRYIWAHVPELRPVARQMIDILKKYGGRE